LLTGELPALLLRGGSHRQVQDARGKKHGSRKSVCYVHRGDTTEKKEVERRKTVECSAIYSYPTNGKKGGFNDKGERTICVQMEMGFYSQSFLEGKKRPNKKGRAFRNVKTFFYYDAAKENLPSGERKLSCPGIWARGLSSIKKGGLFWKKKNLLQGQPAFSTTKKSPRAQGPRATAGRLSPTLFRGGRGSYSGGRRNAPSRKLTLTRAKPGREFRWKGSLLTF